MKKLGVIILLMLSIPAFSADATNNIESQKAAQAWLDSTEECVLDVRDRDVKYRDSHYCRMSVAKMHVYIDSFEGMFINPDPKAEYLSVAAQKFLWMAVALSATPADQRQSLNIDAWQ